MFGPVRQSVRNLIGGSWTAGAAANIDRDLGSMRRRIREVLREKLRRGGEDNRFR